MQYAFKWYFTPFWSKFRSIASVLFLCLNFLSVLLFKLFTAMVRQWTFGDLTLACEYSNSKLVLRDCCCWYWCWETCWRQFERDFEVLSKYRGWCLVKFFKLNLRSDFNTIFGHDFGLEVRSRFWSSSLVNILMWLRFEVDAWSIFLSWILIKICVRTCDCYLT